MRIERAKVRSEGRISHFLAFFLTPMSPSRYHYNPTTCKYEPAKISLTSVAGYAVLFTTATAVLFWGILTLHSKVFLSERGKALKKENATLTKHHASLINGLADAESTLNNLNNQNSNLHKNIFETPLGAEVKPTFDKEAIILTDENGFKSVAEELRNKSNTVSKLSESHDAHFSNLEVGKKELRFFMSIPSIQPIENTELTKLVSGFGKRINPFHKGNYQHPGADFAAARGTSVLATAKGIVVDIQNNSSLQAGYGNFIEIDHGNGIITRYAHLEEVNVRVGQRVSKGLAIGTVGMSGGAVAPHVHYEIIRKGKQVDPVPYMMESLTSTEYTELQKLGNKKNQSLD
jgi:murein DD-endopeptidase MepM/ murein hydrolase activator NlpD